MTDPIKERLKSAPRHVFVNPRPVTRLDDIKNEANEMGNEVRGRIRESITEYQGAQERYQKNKNRALIGLGAGLIGGLIHPYLAYAGFTYAGIKAYQAYKDKQRS